MPPSLAQPTRRGTAALLPALGLSAQTAVPAAEPPLFAIQAFAIEVGRAFPRIALDPEQLDALSVALANGVPTILRRSWEDHFDDRE